MSEPLFDHEDDEDAESMFDFLDEEAANRPRVRQGVDGGGRPLPIIRKPVPISESGPLHAPRADDDVGPEDDFGFLGGGRAPATRERGAERPASGGAGSSARDGSSGGRARRLLSWLAVALLLGGGALSLKSWLPGREGDPDAVVTVSEGEPLAPAAESETGSAPGAASPGSLAGRFRERERLVEELIADGRIDEAEEALGKTDRAVYGYGIAEFRALEERIAQLRAGGVPEAGAVREEGAEAGQAAEEDRVATERRAEVERVTEEHERVESERLAEAGRAAEEGRVAAERRAEVERVTGEQERAESERRAEAERAAEEERLEAERRAEAERERAEAERLEAERRQRAQARRERAAEERAAREAAAAAARAEARAAARERAERLAATRVTAPVERGGEAGADAPADSARAEPVVPTADPERARLAALEADRRATDRRIAEQRASRERREAAEREIPAQAGVSDADLQLVYARLVELEKAVEGRDIERVLALTHSSGARIQQLLQVFENSESLSARVTNVVTRDADLSITGTLRIDAIERSDGSRIRPPAALEALALTTTRTGSSWSAFEW